MRAKFLSVIGCCLLLSACGSGTASVGTDETPPIPLCTEVPRVEAAPEAYEDTPKYVGNEMPTEEVREWASQYPGFDGIWIDREHNGWVTVAFSEDAAQRQAEIDEMFPDDGVVAVEVVWTEQMLTSLQNRVVEELTPLLDIAGVGTLLAHGVVSVHIGVLSDENIAVVEEHFGGEPICVEGIDPAEAAEPGPQQEAGDGWRLLIAERGVGQVYRTGIAWDADSLEKLVAEIGAGVAIPGVDFEAEVAIWFGAVYGSSCPSLRLDDVIVTGSTVHAEIVNPDNPGICTGDANPFTYMVAFERDRLPAPTFHIQLSRYDPPSGVPEERTVVSADLREPGSTATPDQVGPDPSPPEPAPEGSGVIIETGFPWDYTVDLSCGFETIGEVNFYQWVAVEDIPASWIEAARGAETVVVEVLLEEGPEPGLEVTFQGETIRYEPSDQPPCPSG